MIDVSGLKYEEKKAIEELRSRVVIDPDLTEDFTLFYRFLKARDFDVNKAEKMLKKHLNWRKSYQVSSILTDFKPKEFFQCVEPSTVGFDKTGDLVIYTAMGNVDGRDVLKCTTMNEYMKHWIWYLERCKMSIRTLNKKFQEEKKTIQICNIVNLDHLTLANATNQSSIEICVRLMSILQDNYPEGMKCVLIINAPAYYVIGFSICKQLMSNAMLEKIFIFGHDGWKEKLLQIIDADVLPVFLGGNRTDPDGSPLCKTFLNLGGKMPECHYLSDADRYFKDSSQVTKISVPHSGKKEVTVHVEDEGSTIQWEFLVKSKDIDFGLFYEKSEELIDVLPLLRYDTDDGVETGSYRAKLTGNYIFVFDNSYSWISSKEVEYCIKVVKSGV